MEKITIFSLLVIFVTDTLAFDLSGSMAPVRMPSYLYNNYWATQFQQQMQQQQQQMQMTQQPLVNVAQQQQQQMQGVQQPVRNSALQQQQQQPSVIPGSYLPSTSGPGISPSTQSTVNLPRMPTANQQQRSTLGSDMFSFLNLGLQQPPSLQQQQQQRQQQQLQQQQQQQKQQQQQQQQNYLQELIVPKNVAPSKLMNFSNLDRGRTSLSSKQIADNTSTSLGNKEGVTIDISSSALPTPVPEVTGMQTLLEQAHRLQLEEQAHIAERGRQLREQQDLLLAQQGATLKKQQSQLQAFQKQIEQQKKIYQQSIINGMGSDVIRSIIREEVKGQAIDNHRSPGTSHTGTFADAPGNTNSILDPLGLGDANRQLRTGSIHESINRLRSRPPLAGLDSKNNSPFSPSTYSSSSASSASTSLSSLPLSSASSSASSGTLSSSPLSPTAFGIPGLGSSALSNQPQISKSVASSWSVAIQPEPKPLARSRQQLQNPGSIRRSLAGSRSQSQHRDVRLDKSRLFTREHQPSSVTFNSNNPLGLNLNLDGRKNTALRKQSTQLLDLDGDTSYTTYPVSLARPRYIGGISAGRGDRNILGMRHGSLQESTLGTGVARSAQSTPYRVLNLPSSGSNIGSRGAVLENSLGSRRIHSLPHQQLLRGNSNQRQQLRQQQSNLQQELFQQTQQQQQLRSSQQHQLQQLQLRDNGAMKSWSHRQHQDTLQLSRQTQSQTLQRTLPKPRSGLTKQVVDGVEVRATPARRLSPGGPLRIGLDINVRHGVYPIDSLKQTRS